MCRTEVTNSWLRSAASFAGRVHRDERGTISILTVFVVFMFTIVLGMLYNVGRHLDDKLRMQNAADAAAYTGATTMARGMNAIAFSNHLLSEVFALTAYMRAGHADHLDATNALVQQILAAWSEVGQVFASAGSQSGFEKFEHLGIAIGEKVPLEQDLATAFLEMTALQSELTLPVLEYILRGPDAEPGGPPDPNGGFLPQFQRAVVLNTPAMADLAVNDVVARYGTRTESAHGNVALAARLWRTDVAQLGSVDEADPFLRTLPAVDPSPTGVDGPPDAAYTVNAQNAREELARHYLELWIQSWMGPDFAFSLGLEHDPPGRYSGKMSNLINLWRIFACGHLTELLGEYTSTNLPHMIRTSVDGEITNDLLDREYTIVAVVYWPQMAEFFPGVFRNPLRGQSGGNADKTMATTFAQARVFLPAPRYLCCPWQRPVVSWGEVTGVVDAIDPYPADRGADWNLFTQNWMAKLVPATSQSVLPILQQHPGHSELSALLPPQLGDVDMNDIRRINMH
jgi:hypothetical protein